MTVIPKTVYVVSHTHWDREWYKPYHQFRIDLSRIIKGILDTLENDEHFKHFLLDGQSIVLEDYLEIHPEDESRIEKLVMEGSLSVGPWYILPDEFLVSAEATVRNLIYGHRVAGRMGRVQKVGYMPDSFGHIAQMPQILKQVGIDSFAAFHRCQHVINCSRVGCVNVHAQVIKAQGREIVDELFGNARRISR